MARWRGRWAILLLAAGSLPAQQQVRVELGQPEQPPRGLAIGGASSAASCCTWPQGDAASSSPWSIAASALLPGSGQAMLSVSRAVPYLAVELFVWTSYVRNANDHRRSRDGYRDLAALVARAAFSTALPHGDFDYYERMSHYPESGRYDLVAGGGVDPETDSTTFNGSVWLLARRTYWADPSTVPDTASAEWKRAVAFYQSRAYDQTYRWSWTNAPVEYSRFLGLIRASNSANRRALQDLGLIIANHFLSTVDAYVTVRVRRSARDQGFEVTAWIPVDLLRG